MANAVMAIHAFLVVKIILSQSHSVRRFIILFIIIYHLFIIIYSLSFIHYHLSFVIVCKGTAFFAILQIERTTDCENLLTK